MSDNLLWSLVFAAATLGGMGALIFLHRSTVHSLYAALRMAKTQRAALQEELRSKNKRISDLAELEANHSGLEARLARMKEVWLDHLITDNEDDCQKVLMENVWVLSPDYVLNDETKFREKRLSTVFRDHFPDQAGHTTWNARHWQIKVPDTRLPDLTGPAKTCGAFGSLPEDIFLIIELKSSRKTLNWDHIEQVHGYAFALMQNVGEKLRKSRIECLVIGKDCSDEVNDAHLRWGPDPHHAIRIVPLTYRQLYDRACQMTRTFREMAYKNTETPLSVESPANAQAV